MRKKAILPILATLAFLSFFTSFELFQSGSLVPLREVQEGNISISIPSNWFQADLRLTREEILKEFPELQEDFKNGRASISFVAGSVSLEANPSVLLLTKYTGVLESLENLIASTERSIICSGGKVVRKRQISEDEFEIIAYHKQEGTSTLYTCYRESDEVFWEFYFTTHRKWSFLKTPIFRKIYDSFRVLPQKNQYPIPGGAIPA